MPDSIQRPWDARFARILVAPLVGTPITPNHLTTVRLAVGLCAVTAFLPGSYGWSNLGAVLLILSNFLDHTDGELARMSGKGSRFGHFYDLASDALITILLFAAIGIGVSRHAGMQTEWSPAFAGVVAGGAIALIFYLRLRIENILGKIAVKQRSLGGFETEDVLYLFPLLTLCNVLSPALVAAAVCAPLFALWVSIEYRRVMRRSQQLSRDSQSAPVA